MREWLSRWYRFLTVYIPDDYLPGIVGVAMAWEPGAPLEFWVRAAMLISGGIALSLFVHAADNIAGYLNGHDQLAAQQKHERLEPKLMVSGEVGMVGAWVSTLLLAVAGFGLIGYVLLSAHWVGVVLTVGCLFILSQYSIGLKLSYRAMGEFALFSTGIGTPAVFVLLTGRVEFAPFVVGLMLGLFFAGVNVNSNQADYPFDRVAGRDTLAVRLGLERHRRVGLALVVAGWSVFLIGVASGSLPLYALVLLPLGASHWRQVRHLFAGEPLAARVIGFRALRLMFAVMIALPVLERALP